MSIAKGANKIEGGGDPVMYWQRPHMEGSQFKFIPQGSECNRDVTRRRHGAADHGGIVCGNAIHMNESRKGLDYKEV